MKSWYIRQRQPPMLIGSIDTFLCPFFITYSDREVYQMREEKPFQSVRITLSDDAMIMLDGLTNSGKFRSRSATIEEAIRTLHELVAEYYTSSYRLSLYKQQGGEKIPSSELVDIAYTMLIRIGRFVGLRRKERPENRGVEQT